MDYNEQMRKLMEDPQAMAKQSGYNIPEEIRDPQAMVMHLLQTGQIGGPMIQKIMPMLQRMWQK